jgi:hypothetical protein
MRFEKKKPLIDDVIGTARQLAEHRSIRRPISRRSPWTDAAAANPSQLIE